MATCSITLNLGPAMLGHQGGWDEFLLIAIPVVFIGGLLAVANRRVNQRLAEVETSGACEPDPSPTDP